MPAITVADLMVLPRITLQQSAAGPSRSRPVLKVVAAPSQLEGAGFEVRRPFPGPVTTVQADPFLMLDHVGPTMVSPEQGQGAPWHPHRGFETVTYLMDGEIAHHDTNGGGGVIGEGDTQWMTAGAGILHDELPTERSFRRGGPSHAVQLWVNLPAARKFTAPRYQSITGNQLQLMRSADGGALVRIIAGSVGSFTGPGITHTPITYLHATLAAGAELTLPWERAHNAIAYVLTGQGFVGNESRPVREGQLALFGAGDHLTVRAATKMIGGFNALDVLVLGGLPIREPIVAHGPFVMNNQGEIAQAIADYQSGRLGIIPAEHATVRRFSL